MFDIQIRDVPEQQVASVLGRVRVDGLPGFIGSGCDRILTHLSRAGVPLAGPPMVLYHDSVSETGDGPVEVVVPFRGAMDGVTEPDAGLTVRIEPAHREAYTRIAKRQVRYPEILQAYDAVVEWLGRRGASISAPSRECYFDPRPWGQVGDDELAVDIAFPFTDPAPQELPGVTA